MTSDKLEQVAFHTLTKMPIIAFNFTFKGFTGPGACMLTIEAPEGNERPSVVCSQKRNYSGTSITNALEIIAHKLYHEVALRELQNRDAKLIEVQNRLRAYWRGKNVSRPLGLQNLYGRSGVLWIEHYPSGTGLISEESFREVQFDRENSPLWLANYNFETAKIKFGKNLIERASKFVNEDVK